MQLSLASNAKLPGIFPFRGSGLRFSALRARPAWTLCALAAAAFVLVTEHARAQEMSTINSSVRALGMGDAWSSLAKDSSALFYNPAGLAAVRGLNWKIIGVHAGADGMSAYKTVQDLKGAADGSGLAGALNKLYGNNASVGAGGESAFTAPMFGVAIYDHLGTLFKVDNPVYPAVDANLINDYGFVGGFGVPLGPFVALGLDFRYVKRTGAYQEYTASSLADLKTSTITNGLTGWGQGYGVDMGTNFHLPLPFAGATFSAVWRNIGQMTFRPTTPKTSFNVPKEDNDITVGASLDFEFPLISVTPAIEYRYLNSPVYQVARKFDFGVEVGLPIIDIRGGFHEGYYTYGVGVNLGLIKVDFASYGVELGAFPGQIEDRRYAVDVTIELGVGSFGVDGGDGPARAGSGAGASGGSGSVGRGGAASRSIWGTGKLKQRR